MQNHPEKIDQKELYVVLTEVKVKPGTAMKVLELFKATNPALVESQEDWINADFSVSENEDIVVVRAKWRKKSSYRAFSESKNFKEVMGRFGKYFLEKPSVRIFTVLFEM